MWQFPHFWAIAWVAYEDYAKAGYYLLPSSKGRDKVSAIQTFIYSLMLIPVSVLPYYLGVTSFAAAVVVFISGVVYTIFAWNLYRKCTQKEALALMFCSFFYLPIVFIAILIGSF